MHLIYRYCLLFQTAPIHLVQIQDLPFLNLHGTVIIIHFIDFLFIRLYCKIDHLFMDSVALPYPKTPRDYEEPPRVAKPPKKWNSSTLFDEWIYRSGDLVMIRLRVWELTQAEIESAVAPFFIGKEFSVQKVAGSTSEYAHLLTTKENIPILKKAQFQLGTTILRKVPKYVPPPSVKYNVLSSTVPDWVSPSMFVKFFEKFNSDPEINMSKAIKIIRDTAGISRCFVTFSEDSKYTDDSYIAAAMCNTIVFDHNGKTATCIFKAIIVNYQQYHIESKEREQVYLAKIQRQDPEKYLREIAKRKI